MSEQSIKIIGIYKITSPSGKVYIGQSVDIEKRWRGHKNSRHKGKLQSSLISHGYENHTFEVLKECEIEDLNRLERHYQEEYDSVENGLNLRYTSTGDRSGYMSASTKSKMSKVNLSCNPEINKKISNTLSGCTLPESVKRKISNTLTGIKRESFSKTHKSKLSEAAAAQWLSGNTNVCKKIINTETGVIYHSIKLAAASINMKPENLGNRLKGFVANNTNLQYYKI